MVAGAKSALEHALRISLVRADKRIGSGHILLALLRAAGLPLPAAQRRYTLAGFGVVRVDFEFARVPVR